MEEEKKEMGGPGELVSCCSAAQCSCVAEQTMRDKTVFSVFVSADLHAFRAQALHSFSPVSVLTEAFA